MEFANLGLVVVDEQHKLGVRQRAHLRGEGMAQHYLVMTATPIPRTLALSYLADFDASIIDELERENDLVSTDEMKLPLMLYLQQVGLDEEELHEMNAMLVYTPTLYRVQIGRYNDRNEADRIARRLTRENGYKPEVKR